MNRLRFWKSSPKPNTEPEKFYPKGFKSDFCSFPQFSTIEAVSEADLGFCAFTRWFFSIEKHNNDKSKVTVHLKCKPIDMWISYCEQWSVIADIRVRLLNQKWEESVNAETKEEKFDGVNFWRHTFDVSGFVHDDSVLFQIFVGITSIVELYSGNFIDFSKKDDGMSDVILKVNDAKFHVAKQVLSIQSPVFRAMFGGNFAETDGDEVVIREVDLNSFHLFLQYLYLAPIMICEVNVEDLIEMGDRFLAKRVLRDCENFLIKCNLSKEKVVEIATFYNLDRVLCDIITKTKSVNELKELFPNEEQLPMIASMHLLGRIHGGGEDGEQCGVSIISISSDSSEDGDDDN